MKKILSVILLLSSAILFAPPKEGKGWKMTDHPGQGWGAGAASEELSPGQIKNLGRIEQLNYILTHPNLELPYGIVQNLYPMAKAAYEKRQTPKPIPTEKTIAKSSNNELPDAAPSAAAGAGAITAADVKKDKA